MPTDITAPQILDLIRARHSTDLVVPECKAGPTQGARHYVRMDAWVLKRSWAQPCVTVYEIKVARGDYLKDAKWRDYLPCCNCFYFVCPPGLIPRDECPEQAGLCYTSKDAGRLLTRKKAPYRAVDIPDGVWRYVLMCRVRVRSEHPVGDDQEFWRRWMAEKRQERFFGHIVGRRIQQVLDREIQAVREENERLLTLIGRYEATKETMKTIGLDPDNPPGRWQANQAVKAKVLPVIEDIQVLAEQARGAMNKILALSGVPS